MSTDARNIHRRTQPGAADHKSNAKSKADSANVPVHFNPENPPHAEFKDFYPLHVTKVAKERQLSPWVTIVIGVFIIIVAAAAGLYWVLMNEKQITPATPATTSDLTKPNSLKLASGTLTTRSDGTQLYSDSFHGFSLVFPATWGHVYATEEVADTSQGAPPQELVGFRYDLNGAPTDASAIIVAVRVDTAQSLAEWQKVMTAQEKVDFKKVGTAGAYVTSVQYRATKGAEAEEQAAVDSIDTMLSSFTVLK